MLVLSRKAGESILIGGNIEVKVLKVERNTVKLGIEAPREFKVYRKELYERIMLENLQAVRSGVMELKGVINLGKSDGGSDKKVGKPSKNGADNRGGRKT